MQFYWEYIVIHHPLSINHHPEFIIYHPSFINLQRPDCHQASLTAKQTNNQPEDYRAFLDLLTQWFSFGWIGSSAILLSQKSHQLQHFVFYSSSLTQHAVFCSILLHLSKEHGAGLDIALVLHLGLYSPAPAPAPAHEDKNIIFELLVGFWQKLSVVFCQV